MNKSKLPFLPLLFLLLSLSLPMGCSESDDGGTPAPEPTILTVEACLPEVANQTFDVLTWNIEQYPKSAEFSADFVAQIIEESDVDFIAVQEMTSEMQFDALVEALDGWSGQVFRFNSGNLMLGFLYKTNEISIISDPIQLFDEQTEANDYAFTAFRRPVQLSIVHSPSGIATTLINIHLKAFGDAESEDRRLQASRLLKSHIDTNLSQVSVIMLGDYNDEIVDAGNNVFQNFLDDDTNFEFTTLGIAQGPSSGWSFPSFPSQIDQVLITNELFEKHTGTEVISFDTCDDDYLELVSDHRPVIARFQN